MAKASNQFAVRLADVFENSRRNRRFVEVLSDVARERRKGKKGVRVPVLFILMYIGYDPGHTIAAYMEDWPMLGRLHYHVRVLKNHGLLLTPARNTGKGYALTLSGKGEALFRLIMQRLGRPDGLSLTPAKKVAPKKKKGGARKEK